MTSANMQIKRENETGDFIVHSDVAAQLCDVPPATFQYWCRGDMPPPRRMDGKFSVRELGHWTRSQQIIRKGKGGNTTPYLPKTVVLAPKATGMPVPEQAQSSSTQFNNARNRKEMAQAAKAEIEVKMMAGELIPAEDVSRAWGDILSRVKTRMLRVGHAAAAVVVGDDDMVSVQKKITEFIRDGLNELSVDWQMADEDEGDEDGV